jgi:CRP-like cAMP-binding protein
MYFVGNGTVEVKKPGQVLETRQEGDFFGEEAFAIHEEHYTAQLKKKMKAYSARAITYCDLYQLARQDFLDALDSADEETQISVNRSLLKMQQRLFQNPYWLALKQLRENPQELKKILASFASLDPDPVEKYASGRKMSRMDIVLGKLAEDKLESMDDSTRDDNHNVDAVTSTQEEDSNFHIRQPKISVIGIPKRTVGGYNDHTEDEVGLPQYCKNSRSSGSAQRKKTIAVLDLAVSSYAVEDAISQQAEMFEENGPRRSQYHRSYRRISQVQEHGLRSSQIDKMEMQIEKLQTEVICLWRYKCIPSE